MKLEYEKLDGISTVIFPITQVVQDGVNNFSNYTESRVDELHFCKQKCNNDMVEYFIRIHNKDEQYDFHEMYSNAEFTQFVKMLVNLIKDDIKV